MISHLPNEKFQPAHDQGTRVSPHLPQNDQRTVSRTSTGPHKANNVVVTDKVPSNCLNFDLHPVAAVSQGLVIPSCSKKKLMGPSPAIGVSIVLCFLFVYNMVSKRSLLNFNMISRLWFLFQAYTIWIMMRLLSSHQCSTITMMHWIFLPLIKSQNFHRLTVHPMVVMKMKQSHGGWPFCTAKRLPPLDGPFQSLTEQELVFFDKPGPEYSQANANKKKRPRNDWK